MKALGRHSLTIEYSESLPRSACIWTFVELSAHELCFQPPTGSIEARAATESDPFEDGKCSSNVEKVREAWECNECVAQIVDAARMLSTGHSEKVTVATAEACITDRKHWKR